MPRCAPARSSGGPKPPFTPVYELVGVHEDLGLGLLEAAEGGPRRRAMQWGADAERVCVPEAYAVRGARRRRPGRGPEPRPHLYDAYQMFTARRRPEWGDGARARRGRQGGNCGPRARGAGRTSRRWDGSADDRAAVERVGAGAIDYRNEDLLARGRELTGADEESPSTRSAARRRCAPSVRRGPAEGRSSTAARTPSRMGSINCQR